MSILHLFSRVNTTFYLFINQLIDIMNAAAISILVQYFVWAYVYISLRYIYRGGIAGSYGNCV